MRIGLREWMSCLGLAGLGASLRRRARSASDAPSTGSGNLFLGIA